MTYDRYKIKDLDLIDCLGEGTFDNLTEFASSIMDAPISLISIIDRANDIQTFKSSFGLPEPWNSCGETPLSHSFCRYVATDDEPLIVEDAPQHKRLKNNLAISDFGIIAYLGVPIHDPQGQAIGALCAFDVKPREWKKDDISTMKTLALYIDSAIKLGSATKNDKMSFPKQAELTYALSDDTKTLPDTLEKLLTELDPFFETPDAGKKTLSLNKTIEKIVLMGEKTVDILQYTHTNKDKGDIEGVDLNIIIKEILDDLSELIQTTNAKINLEPLPIIQANPKHMRMLFQILLSKALKFQPADQVPEITISSDSDIYDDIITITENGISVDEKYQDHVFKLFGRLYTQENFQGTDLGLALSARIVNSMNGGISIQSRTGKGTTFNIQLPKTIQSRNIQ